MSKDANSSAPSTPSQALYSQWVSILSETILKQSVVGIVCQWLTSHPHYSINDFWSQSSGKQKQTPLAYLFSVSPHPAYVLPALKQLLDSLPQDVQSDQFNRADSDGRVLLHLLWDKVNKKKNEKGYSYGGEPSGLKEYCQQFISVLEKTDKCHWTWLDNDNDNPGEGFRRQLMALLEGVPYDSVANLSNRSLEALNEVYPAVPRQTDPAHSPWKTALSSSSIQALTILGHRLDETVRVGELEVPAWRWILLNTLTSPRDEVRNAVIQTAQDQGVEGVEEWLAQTSEARRQWLPLSPDSRRSTTGYVAKVLGFKQKDGSPAFDITGSSPLDHLLARRSDLFGMFSGKATAMPPQEFTERFMQPDAAGVPAVLRYFSAVSQENLPTLRKLLEHHGCWEEPAKLLRDSGGLFRFKEDMANWSNLGLSFLGDIKPSDFSSKELADPEIFFGPLDQQQHWIDFWEDNVSSWPAARKLMQEKRQYEIRNASPSDDFIRRFVKTIYPQLELFLANAGTPSWEEKLDPRLRDILHVACCYLTTGMSNSSQIKHFNTLEAVSAEAKAIAVKKDRFNPTVSWGGVTLSRDPPETVSSAIVDWLASPEGKVALVQLDSSSALPTGKLFGSSTQGRESWDKWVVREKLRQVVSRSTATPIEPSERKVPKM